MSERRRRAHMVEDQVVRRGVRDPLLLDALREVPRDRFVPPGAEGQAYRDESVPIGFGERVGPVWSTALVISRAGVRPGDRVLEIGTGSGYQAGVLAAMGARVTSIELRVELAERARRVLGELGYDVDVRCADGRSGCPEGAPWRIILVGAAVVRVPSALLDQLEVGGRLVAPVGDADLQELVTIERTATGFARRGAGAVLFTPLR